MLKRYGLVGSGVVCLFALAAACSSSDKAPVVGGNDGGAGGASGGTNRAGAGGKSGAPSEAGAAGEGNENSLAPTVEITAPVAVTDPEKAGVLTTGSVLVVCKAVKSSEPDATDVLGSSLKIRMLGADGKQLGADGAVMSTGNPGEYSASFVLTTVPSGPLSFTCTASDSSPAVNTATDTVKTFYDGGPAITLGEPLDKSAHSLGEVLFRFSALPTALATGDDGAAVEKVTLKVNGVDIDNLVPVTNMPGSYQRSVDLNDKKVFLPTPVGTVPFTITATNARGTVASQSYTFIVDSTGPVVSIVSPATDSVKFVGGQVTLKFAVNDEVGGSQVDPATVTVKINTKAPVHYEEGNFWHLAPDLKTFDYTFNTADYPSQFQISVEINANDKAGNKAQSASGSYYVDTIPPIIDLDVADVQERQPSLNGPICSVAFNPLGNAPKDLSVVKSVNFFRAIVWDEGNQADANNNGISYYSDVDPTKGSVRMFFQEDATKPLLKNKKGEANGVCDEIADLTLPVINLDPILPSGLAYYSPAAATAPNCGKGTDVTPPQQLCGSVSPLSRVIAHENGTMQSTAVVYGFQKDNAAQCTGGQLDLTTKVTKDGWVCAAVVAQDSIGNQSVSAPLRLCLDAADSAGANFVGQPACVNGLNPPSCVVTTNCTKPAEFLLTVVRKP